MASISASRVMVPMIGFTAEARDLVDVLRYPPNGIGGIAGSRATGYGRNMEEYVNTVNGSILTIAQIETEEGLTNVREIAEVNGIDALFVGAAELSGALHRKESEEDQRDERKRVRITIGGP